MSRPPWSDRMLKEALDGIGAGQRYELVPVMVPRSRLQEVYALLGAGTLPAPSSNGERDRVAWSEDDCARLLADTATACAKRTVEVMDILVENPGVHYDVPWLCEQLGLMPQVVRGMASALSRHLKKHYGRTNPPFEREFVDSVTLYWVEPDVAEAWLRARARQQ